MEFSKESVENIYNIDYIQNNLSKKAIGEKYGVSEDRIRRLFKLYNLPTKLSHMQHSKYFLNENYFEIIDTEEKAYWLGFLYADGNVFAKNGQNVLTLSLQSSDEDHIIKFNNALDSNAKISRYTRVLDEKYSASELSILKIGSKKLVSDLINIGCVPNKTFKTVFPSEDIVPRHLIKHFIRGVFDGDGCISISHENDGRKNPHIDFQILGTKELLDGISLALFEEGVLMKEAPVKQIPNQKIYRLRVGGIFNAIRIKKYLYESATVYLERKFDKFAQIEDFKNIPEYPKLPIKDSEKICSVCGDENSKKYHRCHVPGDFDGKILCSKHYYQIKTYGRVKDKL